LAKYYYDGAGALTVNVDDVAINDGPVSSTMYAINLLSEQNTAATTNLGTITCQGTNYILPNIATEEAGTCIIQYIPATGYNFDRWITSGSIIVTDTNAASTTITVTGDCTLKAIYKAEVTDPQSVSWNWGSDTVIKASITADVDGDGVFEIVTGGYYFDGIRNVAQLAVWNAVSLALENVKVWHWDGDTTINSISVADVDGDAEVEIVTGGSFFDGSRTVAQLVVWDGATLAFENVKVWHWDGDTTINSISVADVDGDAEVEIVTGGSFFDGSRTVAQLVVWDGATLAFENVKVWHWDGDTTINSISVADVDGDAEVEIVTGGYYFDGIRNVAQLVVWSGGTLSFESVKVWYWNGDTVINSIAVEDVDGDGFVEIVTGGCYFDDTRDVAQLAVWSGATLELENVRVWYWDDDTVINSLFVANIDGDADVEIVTGGYYLGSGLYVCGQVVTWTGSSLAFENAEGWYSGGATLVTTVSPLSTGIVTGGYFNDGILLNAQLNTFT
jgi:hypothetical protein